MALVTLFGVCSVIIGSRAEFGHSGQYADRFEKGLDLNANRQVKADVEPESDPIIGCCRGIDSSCKTTSEATCEKMSKRKGCEWLWGTGSNPPDCSDPTPEPGCCAGPSADCYETDDETSCSKLSRRQGCEWRAGKDADCTPTTAPPGCCYGEDSKCWDADESNCLKNARRAGCEWIIGTMDNPPDCTPPTPEPGCCAGEAACQVTWLDQNDCEKLARREGCEWRSGKDADCTPTTPPPGCCYGTSTKCQTEDQATCLKMASRAGCEWRSDTPDQVADCTPPTPEPGCCSGNSVCTAVDDEMLCSKLARRSGCEWIPGAKCATTTTTSTPETTETPIQSTEPATTESPTTSTTEPTTTLPGPVTTSDGTCSTNHRHRVSWQETTQENRDLYIRGFKTLADQGIMWQFTQCHLESSEHSTHEFLPWHREFVFRLEEAIRGLGGEFACFTLPYWDWTMEPTPYDVKYNGAELYILNSGLGPDGDGECVVDDVWGKDAYTPNGWECLMRDLDYPDEAAVCTFYSAAQVMDIIDWSSDYGNFRPAIEGTPHALPHVCIGGDKGNHMATYYSPDDPIFYLHHTFVDFIWAVWQDCNNYDGVMPESDSFEYDARVTFQLSYSPLSTDRPYPRVSETFDIRNDYDVSYEMGAFWNNARVSARDNCAAEDNPINDAWFYNTVTTGLKAHQSMSPTQAVEQAIIDEAFAENPESTYEENIATAAEQICEYVQHSSNILRGFIDPATMPECKAPAAGLTDCGSDEDAITLEMVLGGELSPCAIDARTKLFSWAETMQQKQFLCRGCYDPYCDAESKAAVRAMDCHLDSESHQSDAVKFIDGWTALALLETARDGVADNVNVVVMVCALLMLFAAKWSLDRGEHSKNAQVFNAVREDSAYGSVSAV